MHRRGGTQEGAKVSGSVWGQREYRQAAGGTENRRQEKSDSHAQAEANHAQAMLVSLDNRISTMQQDFTAELRKISGKESEKFDLIFAILSELQNRQGQLEESVRSFKVGYSNTGGGGLQQTTQTPQGQQQQQPQQQQPQQQQQQPQQPQQGQQQAQQQGQQQAQQQSQLGQYNQAGAQMQGQMNNQMNNQMNMQQQYGMMHCGDSQAVFAPIPQVIVLQSPGAGMQPMQYAVPQMMMPVNGMQMQQQMAMQYVGQGQGGDYQWAADDSVPVSADSGQMISPKCPEGESPVVNDDAKAAAVEAVDGDRSGLVAQGD